LLANRRVLITGSSQGIGLAVGAAMLRHGALVVFTSERNAEGLSAECRELLEHPNACYLRADLARPDAAEVLVQDAWLPWNGLDVLVNNVGTFREPPLLDCTYADFQRIFDLNVWSALAVTQAFVRRAQAAGHGGRILFSSSLNGTRSEPGHTLYDASKGAVNALCRQLAIELAPLGFTTAAVAPGLIETPLTDFGLRSDPAARAAVEAQIPVGRIGTVADVAEWYAFLASDAACYANGIVVPVCGGLDAQQMPSRPLTAAERR
jgi:glucose 1-dehydrogenase